MLRGAISSVILALTLAPACIVTDKIEFVDKVNHPPEVIKIEPSNLTVSPVSISPQPFSVQIWDPDEEDAITYAAKLFMWIESIGPQTKECTVSELPTAGEQIEGYNTGVQLHVECLIDLQIYQLQEDTILLFQMQVSDLGYNQSVLPEGARTAEVVWVRKVEPGIS